MSLNIGTILEDHYLIEKPLAKGGMGEIYVAIDTKLNIEVAVKTISANQKMSAKLIRLFRSEAARQAQLRHEAIPQIKDFFTFEKQYCIVMELIEGIDLGKKVEKSKTPFEVEAVLDWADQILDVLDYIHNQGKGVFHRDIKPSNLKLTSRNRIKLLDFGIAKGNVGEMTIVDTKTVAAASAPYASLEQGINRNDWYETVSAVSDFHKEKADQLRKLKAHATEDIFSLGATLYQFLTKTLPLTAHSRAIGYWNNRGDQIKPLSELNPEVPEDISRIIMQSLALKREDRPQTAAEMRQMLQEARQKYLSLEAEKRRQEEFEFKLSELNAKWNSQIFSLLHDVEAKHKSEVSKYQTEINELIRLQHERKIPDEQQTDKFTAEIERYAKLVEEQKKFIELEKTKNLNARFELSKSKAEIEKLHSKNADLTATFASAINKLEQSNINYSKAKQQIKESDGEISNLEQKLKSMQNELHGLRNSVTQNNDSYLFPEIFAATFFLLLVSGFTWLGFNDYLSPQFFSVAANSSDQNANTGKTSNTKSSVLTAKRLPAPTPKYVISDLQATVESMKFFECGGEEAAAVGKRNYISRFIRSRTKYVCFELNLSHPPSDTPKTIELTSAWFREGKGITSFTNIHNIEAHTTSSSLTGGYGDNVVGNLFTGNYQVTIRYENEIIANNIFQVTQ